MVVKRFKFPLREDHTFQLIIATHEEDDKVAKLLKEDEEYLSKLYGFACDNGLGTFSVVLYEHTLSCLVHECNHIAFYAGEKFGINNKEFHCMVTEWLFDKARKYVIEK